MAFEYRIDSERSLVRTRWTGRISIDQFIARTRRVHEDPAFKPGMNTLSDCREADWSEEDSTAHEFVWHTEVIEKSRGAARWAVLVSDPDQFEAVETFDMVLKQRGIGIETRAFRIEDDALAWLGAGS